MRKKMCILSLILTYAYTKHDSQNVGFANYDINLFTFFPLGGAIRRGIDWALCHRYSSWSPSATVSLRQHSVIPNSPEVTSKKCATALSPDPTGSRELPALPVSN